LAARLPARIVPAAARPSNRLIALDTTSLGEDVGMAQGVPQFSPGQAHEKIRPASTMSFPKALKSLTPAKSEALPCTGGCLATGCLHAIASVLLIGYGTTFLGQEGGLIVLPFWVFLGVFEWIYLAPLALLLRRLRFVAASKGVWLGGVLVILMTGLYWGGLGVMSLVYWRQAQVARQFAKEHPLIDHEVSGTIVAADAKHIEVQTSEGVVSVGLGSATHYIRTNGPFGNTKAAPDIVKVGAPVVIKATSFDNGPLYADYVEMEVPEPATTPSPQ
jgi:hypothetical protein